MIFDKKPHCLAFFILRLLTHSIPMCLFTSSHIPYFISCFFFLWLSSKCVLYRNIYAFLEILLNIKHLNFYVIYSHTKCRIFQSNMLIFNIENFICFFGKSGLKNSLKNIKFIHRWSCTKKNCNKRKFVTIACDSLRYAIIQSRMTFVIFINERIENAKE